MLYEINLTQTMLRDIGVPNSDQGSRPAQSALFQTAFDSKTSDLENLTLMPNNESKRSCGLDSAHAALLLRQRIFIAVTPYK